MTEYAWFALLLCTVLAACAVVGWHRRRMRRTLLHLQSMLDAALAGDFSGIVYDESLLSSVELQVARYLAHSVLLEQNLAAEKETIKSLIADISHQTKTPLANVLLYGQLLAERPLDAEGRACVAALQAQAEKLDFLIAALVKTSRLETGVLAVSPARHAVGPMLERVAGEIAPRARAKRIALTLPRTEETAYFDPRWTAEALYNIVDNAVKYTPEGGRVAISVVAYELFCRIDIADNGMGVAEEEQARIFTRFYRSPSAGAQEGVGIGLYLARQIVGGEGGYIKVRSSPGQGATFLVFLARER